MRVCAQVLREFRCPADVAPEDIDANGDGEVRLVAVCLREREREENPRVSGERACCIEAMQQSGSTNPGASAMRHHREAAELGLA
jgi:hypothetical protein